MTRPYLDDEEKRKMIDNSMTIPLHPKKYGRPEEVSELLAFLVDERNSLMTGQVICSLLQLCNFNRQEYTRRL